MEMKVGDRVVCIARTPWDDEDIDTSVGVVFPRYGWKLTVRYSDDEYLMFEEIVNPIIKYLDGIGECEFHSSNFRKLETYTAKETCVNFNTVEEGLEISVPEKVKA